MPIPGNLLTTAMAVMPHTDVDRALEVALSMDIPFWPQLPNYDYYEDMYVQAAEHFPGILLDTEKKTLRFSIDKFKDFYTALKAVLTDDRSTHCPCIGLFFVVGRALIYNCIQLVGANIASILVRVNIPVSVVIGVLFLHEPLNWQMAAGVLLIIVGITLTGGKPLGPLICFSKIDWLAFDGSAQFW